MKTLEEQLEIIQEAIDGKDIEINCKDHGWSPKLGDQFNFIDCDYRVKHEPMEFWVNVYDDGVKVIIGHEENIEQYTKNGLNKTIKVREVTDE